MTAPLALRAALEGLAGSLRSGRALSRGNDALALPARKV